ncbi:MAG: aminopeptidase [Thermoplasmata archaeon]|nr:aminopeptidase [Thermoplasmata archaeon]
MSSEEGGPEGVAKALLGGALALKRGENLLIETWNHTLPYAAACVVEARRLGASPVLQLEDEAAYWRSFESPASSKGLGRVGAHEWAALAKSQAFVFFPGPADSPRLNALPAPERVRLQAYNGEWYRRAKAARIRGVRSMLGYATDARATQLGVSAAAWRTQLVRATIATNLKTVRADAQRAAAKLKRGKLLRVTAPNGTDVTLKLRGRSPTVDDGVVTPEDVKSGQNVTASPPGAVVVAVDERSAEGVAIANRPTFWRPGRLEGGQWEMHAGHLTNAWYTDGQATFDEAYQAAPKGKDVIGIFSIGLNPALEAGVPLVEDQEAGAVTLGLGGNANYGGSNRCPFLSWVVLGEATVAVDGVPLSDRGKLL